MQEEVAHVVVDVENNVMTRNIDTVVEDTRLRRNTNARYVPLTWTDIQAECSCGLGCRHWIILKTLIFAPIVWSHEFIIEYWMWERFQIGKNAAKLLCILLVLFNFVVVAWVFERCRGRPYRTVGRFGRGVVDLITLGSAIFVRFYLPNHDMYPASKLPLRSLVSGPLQVLLLVTMYIHGWGQTLHLLSDIRKRDLMLGAIMQVLIYYVSIKTVHVFLVIFFCFVVISYRICSYKVPANPDLVKKDLGPLPS